MQVLHEQLQDSLTLIFGYSQIPQEKFRKAQGTEMTVRLLKLALAFSIPQNYGNSQRSAVMMDQVSLNAVMTLKCLSEVGTWGT